MEKELFAQRMEAYHARVEDFLAAQCTETDTPYNRLLEAMHYSLMAGGKRLRPILTMEFCRLCGGDTDAVLSAACGVEMLHTYSLIHDDLPCMDNDDLRRGKPSNHKVFGEAAALLAGDALQALAFETVLSAPLAPERALRCGQILTHAAGHAGICGGQQLDLEWEALHQAIGEFDERVFAELCRGVSAEEVETLLRITDVMLENARKMNDARGFVPCGNGCEKE